MRSFSFYESLAKLVTINHHFATVFETKHIKLNREFVQQNWMKI